MLAWWIACAFALGLTARACGLPPLVGFLAAGFVLHGLGVSDEGALRELGRVGVWLLLFTVGLKLRIRTLLRPEVWVTAATHLAISAAAAAALVHASVGLGWAAAWVLGAAFGFSSTVLTVIILEPKRELRAFHGRVAVGILIVQDLVAVGLLAVGADRTPSPWGVLLLLLPLTRPLLDRLLSASGHGELFALLAVLLAVAAGGYGFDELGLSPELGSVILGALLASHPRATEMGATLWGMKELFLVAFFLSIGLAGLPTPAMLAGVAVLLAALPVKAALFFLLLVAAGLRARSGLLAALALASYSEFGLIVIQLAVDRGLLAADWLPLAAVSVAASFAVAAPLNRMAHAIYTRWEPWLQRLERARRHPDDEPVSIGAADVLVVGMGRVGSGAFHYLRELGLNVVGLDSDVSKVEAHVRAGRRVAYADAEDPELWHRLKLDRVRAIMLALPDLEAKILASQQLRRRGFRGLVAATHVYEEERELILAAGCDLAYNYFNEAGTGFAAHISDALHALARSPTQS